MDGQGHNHSLSAVSSGSPKKDDDLEYPKEQHHSHNSYLLAPEKIKINNKMLSPYQEKIKNKYNISIEQVSKLVPTLMDKKLCPPL